MGQCITYHLFANSAPMLFQREKALCTFKHLFLYWQIIIVSFLSRCIKFRFRINVWHLNLKANYSVNRKAKYFCILVSTYTRYRWHERNTIVILYTAEYIFLFELQYISEWLKCLRRARHVTFLEFALSRTTKIVTKIFMAERNKHRIICKYPLFLEYRGSRGVTQGTFASCDLSVESCVASKL